MWYLVRMHIINIERVKNGWVVRPHQPPAYGCCAVAEETYVYNTVEALTAALPDLLRTYHPSSILPNPPHEI